MEEESKADKNFIFLNYKDNLMRKKNETEKLSFRILDSTFLHLHKNGQHYLRIIGTKWFEMHKMVLMLLYRVLTT